MNTSDAEIDLWNDGALDALRRKPRASDDATYLAGYEHGLDEARVHAVIERPEGYFHFPIGTFD